ncbi:GNAT family N-acetyltransferase [Maribacter stanieri]|uniref:GNAT family N-acetyltransferase n=1 Tax=Maribacter stanieri TaxID=440514 RepID=UPI00249569BB|nr:GNAT family N-acetyltransferase [Maribacter stanieri]|tara:strand:- start:3574 stop:3999 length:426 start_codon:yes stop_codon:yes gene_type:complete
MIIKLITFNEVTTELQTQLTELYKQLNSELTQLDLASALSDYNTTDVVICLDNEDLVGIAMMAKYKVVSGHKGMIEDVVVSSNYRGKGIGRKLMEKLLEQAEKEKLDDILLFSGHHRTAAISLYKSLGFKLKESGMYIKKY